MKRLAFVSPLPPAPTGIADYAAEVLALLTSRYDVDVFHAQESVERARLPGACDVFPAAMLLDRHGSRPYDLAIYQMGNGPAHAFLYEILPRLPGLLVLHDLVLHHSRARAFLDTPDARAYAADPSSAVLRARALEPLSRYEAEVVYSHPAGGRRIVETHLATVGDLLPYAYPLFRLPVEASRATAVHNAFMARAVEADVPGARAFRIPMAAQPVTADPGDVAALRARLGLAPQDWVVACFGLLTREKRIETVARAVARAVGAIPRLRLLLVGPAPDAARLERRLEDLGVRERAVVTGRVPFGELPLHVEAADLVVHLRYPTARETSAALLRVLAQGRPTVISDLEHLDDIPADAVVRADPADEEGEVTRAILRLAERPAVCARLGRAAAAFVRREHSPERCRAGYVEAVEAAMALPDPRPREGWPAHWRSGATAPA